MFNISGSRVHQLISGYKPTQGISPLLKDIYGLAYKRDNYTCQRCNKKTKQKNIIIHHIDNDDTNNVLENLICLCRGCHRNLHLPINENAAKEEAEADKKRTIKSTRNKIICEVWKKYKTQGLRLIDLAEIFSMEPPHIFYILKTNYEQKTPRRKYR